MGSDERTPSVKVVMLGDTGTGKTAILTRFFDGKFDSDVQSTIGIDFRYKKYRLDDYTTVTLQLWDTAGQERFRQLTPSYIREAAVALIVFDLTDDTAVQQIARWVKFVEYERGPETQILLVGNKSDMKSKRRMTNGTLMELMKENKAMFIETSAKTGENIEELFACVAHLPYPQHKKSQSQPIKLSSMARPKSNCCAMYPKS